MQKEGNQKKPHKERKIEVRLSRASGQKAWIPESLIKKALDSTGEFQ
jgi:hypothetical protein